MPNIEHVYDSSIPSILDDNIKAPSTFKNNDEYEKYFTLKHRNYYVEAVKNGIRPMFGGYRTLDLVSKLPEDDSHIRYGNKFRVHESLSKNPPRITTWTEDIIKSNSVSLPTKSASSTATMACSTSSTSTHTESPTTIDPGTCLIC